VISENNGIGNRHSAKLADCRKPSNKKENTMGKLSGKKLLLLGERDGVPGPAMAAAFANSGAEVLFSATECFV
jgi:betaine reductase